MATLKLCILPYRRKANGRLGIYISVTHHREVRYISTDFEIDDDFQFEDGKVCYRKDAEKMNRRLQYVLQEYAEKLEQINLATVRDCAHLKKILTSEEEQTHQITINELFERRIAQLREEGRNKYADMNEYSRSVIVSILSDTPIVYITRNDIKVLEKQLYKRGYSNCNVQMRMAHFKAAINAAVDSDVLRLADHPFRGYKMPKSEVRMMDVTLKEFESIYNVQCPSSRVMLARDMWLLSFYLGGINLADLVKADLSGPVLSYQRSKTKEKKSGNKDTVLSIQPEARKIIKKYIGADGCIVIPYNGSYQNKCSYLNKCLKLLAAEAFISQTNFSFYSARKTFAQFAFEIGIRTEVIEYCIGQSVKANRPVYNYVRVMQRYADEAMRNVIDYAHKGVIHSAQNIAQ